MEIMKRRLIESQWEMHQWHSDPFMLNDSTTNPCQKSPFSFNVYLFILYKISISAHDEVFLPRSPSSIKKEPERMEIVKRRMVDSQREMDRWPMARRDFKVEGKRDYGRKIVREDMQLILFQIQMERMLIV